MRKNKGNTIMIDWVRRTMNQMNQYEWSAYLNDLKVAILTRRKDRLSYGFKKRFTSIHDCNSIILGTKILRKYQ